jgi:hypothetical protein
VGFVEGETGYFSETCGMSNVDGTGEVRIKVEEDIDIKEEVSIKFEAVYVKDEIPETAACPPIKIEQEVRLWGIFEVVAALAFRRFICPKKEIVKLNVTISHFVLYCLSNFPVQIWITVPKEKDFWQP